jgi:GNAT superfamily N-acetyltransferase
MDTLVYYGRSLETLPPPVAIPQDTVIRPATSEDVAAVSAIAREAFRGYLGHYHVDPRLDDGAATEAYADWAGRSLRELGDTKTGIVAYDRDGIMGFLTTRQNSSEEEEIVLNAVSPPKQGTGIYAALLAHSLVKARERGCLRMLVSTQINNYAVQRVWSRSGFLHERSYHTLHKWFD